MKRSFFVLLALLGALLPVAPAIALDTTEPFDLGFSNYEFYAGIAGLGAEGDKTLTWEGLIGVGLTPRFSASLSFAAETDEYFRETADELALGLFWTALERERFSLDLFGGYATAPALSFGLEANLDFPRWGLQLVLEDSLRAKEETRGRAHTFNVAPLAYVNLMPEKLQLLAQVDWSYASDASDGTYSWSKGAASLGLNALVHADIELILQIDYNLPNDEEDGTWGGSIGFVATVPGG
jgi:hypothetical protein